MELFGFESFLQISPITAMSTILVIFLGILYYALKDKGIPPGPRGLPFFGYWPFLKDETVHLQLQKQMKKYGDVYSFTSVGQLYIHLGSIQAIKEAHVTKADCFSERYSSFSVLTVIFREGVAVLNGEAWKTVRKFFVQAFREFGLTSMKDYLTGPVYDSVTSAVDDLRAADGKPVNIINILTIRCSNILRRMLFNDDGITEKELADLIEAFEKVVSIFTPTRMLLHGDFTRRFIFPLYSDNNTSMENLKLMDNILRNVIKRHEEQFDEDSIRDMIDSYIKERNDRRRKNDPTFQYFTEKCLISSLIEFVGDGILSVALFISYFIDALLEHPEEQDKIFKELEDVVGHDRQPTLEDKSKMPYTNAFMQEVQRTTGFFTIFPSLQCTNETTLNGYRIPKGSITMMNLWACHRDPKIFKDPNEFRPSRYLTEPGKPKLELPILFGVGKRACAGETFTIMQVFLFLTTIVKNFRLTKAEEEYNKKKFILEKQEICAHPRN